MVIRLTEPLTADELSLAAQGAVAPALQPPPAGTWTEAELLPEVRRWNGGTWHPGIRSVPLRLYNAGPVPAEIKTVRVTGAWLEPVALNQPLPVPAYSWSESFVVPLRPQGFTPSWQNGQVRFLGPGVDVAVQLYLDVPEGALPWWEPAAPLLATHIQEHTVRLEAKGGGNVQGELSCMGVPINAPPPVVHGSKTVWTLPLISGDYGCTLRVDGTAVELMAPAPHRWEWERTGAGRLLAGASSQQLRLWNVGEKALELHMDSTAQWLDVKPQHGRLAPGDYVDLLITDRLTHLDSGDTEGFVRLLRLPEREEWARIPVRRDLSARMSLPVVTPRSLVLRTYGTWSDEAELEVRNAGGTEMRLEISASEGLTAVPCDGDPVVPPGGTHRVKVTVPETARGAGGATEVRIRSDSAHPLLRESRVPVVLERLSIKLNPLAIDYGNVAYNTYDGRKLKFERSDGKIGKFQVDVPLEASDWLMYEYGQLTVSNRCRTSGEVRADVLITEMTTGARETLPVRALLERPRVRYEERIVTPYTRPHRKLRRTVRIWDEGQGLQLRSPRCTGGLLTATLSPDIGVELEIRTGRVEGTRSCELTVQCNDPDHPVIRIPVIVRVRDNWLDKIHRRLDEAGLLWLAPVGLIVLLALLGSLITLGWLYFFGAKPAPQPEVPSVVGGGIRTGQLGHSAR